MLFLSVVERRIFQERKMRIICKEQQENSTKQIREGNEFTVERPQIIE